MSDDDLRRLAAATGAPFQATSDYFNQVEPLTERAWQHTIGPFIGSQNLLRVVDLATGHGRHTEQLLQRGASEVYALDVQPDNIELCRRRFAARPSVRCETTNGLDFRPVPDGWATFIFCFDAMVHFDSDVVRSYLSDCRRVLAPDGVAFFHHSNYTGDSQTWSQAPHARNFMSAPLFRHYARKEQLRVVNQAILAWGGIANLDCLTIVGR